MRSTKRKLTCGLILALFFLSSCTTIGDLQKRAYEDDSIIAAVGDSYTYANRLGNVRISELSVEFADFYGKETVWEITAHEETMLDLDVSAAITKGKLKLCHVSEANQVTTIFENTHTEVISVSVPQGVNRLILVGYGADGKVSVKIQPDNDHPSVDVKVIRF